MWFLLSVLKDLHVTCISKCFTDIGSFHLLPYSLLCLAGFDKFELLSLSHLFKGGKSIETVMWSAGHYSPSLSLLDTIGLVILTVINTSLSTGCVPVAKLKP